MNDKITDILCERLFVEIQLQSPCVYLTDAQAHALFGHSLSRAEDGTAHAQLHICTAGQTLENVTVYPDAAQPSALLPEQLCDGSPVMLLGTLCSVSLRTPPICMKNGLYLTERCAAFWKISIGNKINLAVLDDRKTVFSGLTVHIGQHNRLFLDAKSAGQIQSGTMGRLFL